MFTQNHSDFVGAADPKPNLADAAVVRELFDMAAREVLFRLVSVSTGRMQHDRARDMDEALAKHLARAFMGENPDFESVAGWHGTACAQSFEAVDPAFYEELWKDEPKDDCANPRVRMVRATTTFYRMVYRVIRREMDRADVTQESVQQALDTLIERWVLAALPATKADA